MAALAAGSAGRRWRWIGACGAAVVIVAVLWWRQHASPPAIPFTSVVVAERFRTTAPHGESDSLAVYRAAAGQTSLLFLTDKHGDRLQVFDAASGAYLRDLGTHGDGPGQFRRPNGAGVWQSAASERAGRGEATASAASSSSSTDAILIVVERDGARVQLFALPDMTPLCVFGAGELRKPYGVAVDTDARGRPIIFITDNSSSPAQRVRRYDCRNDDSRGGFACTRAFGETSGPGELRLVESIVADPLYHRLYVCDEHHRIRNVKVYSEDGDFLGITFGDGYITDDPEGIALWPDGPGGWIVQTNQGKKRSTFHVFDRKTFAHVGAFVGKPAVANTDGVALTLGTLGALKGGGFYAVDDDTVVAAYALDDIAAALKPAQPTTATERGQ